MTNSAPMPWRRYSSFTARGARPCQLRSSPSNVTGLNITCPTISPSSSQATSDKVRWPFSRSAITKSASASVAKTFFNS
ncbi:Uncharacterised protein [Vibrio cholerae]|nr:Uncharacterised protein [Vibrio cholerae]